MRIASVFIYVFLIPCIVFGQKNSLIDGDSYAEDQVYFSVSYSQFNGQPSGITKSNFSYSLSTGFMKDVILNNSGTISLALGVGYGYDFFNHKLKIDENNGITVFGRPEGITGNTFKAHNLEFPFEYRWRTSSATKYGFWRVYTGVKILYNLKNKFQYEDKSGKYFKYSNVSAYNKLQYGLTLSVGYDAFNMNLFYGLSPVFKEGSLNTEPVDTKILKFGLIFYFL